MTKPRELIEHERCTIVNGLRSAAIRFGEFAATGPMNPLSEQFYKQARESNELAGVIENAECVMVTEGEEDEPTNE